MTDTLAVKERGAVLATDLDGTLIPLEGNDENQADLKVLAGELHEHGVTLVFVTGRHFESVSRAIDQLQLPPPDWIICDVGTSIYERGATGDFRPIDAYVEHLQQIISVMPIEALRERLEPIEGLRPQEQEKQGRFKLSYYADAAELDRLFEEVQANLSEVAAPYSIVRSVDPFNGNGLIDLLPSRASKSYALEWWCAHTGASPDSIVFAGDSGNDLAALTAGHRAIVVANADHEVVQRAYHEHREAGWQNRLYVARGTATSGVLEGCRWFELIGRDAPTVRSLGATPVTYQQTHFRVWAPDRRDVNVEISGSRSSPQRFPLARDSQGYFCGVVRGASSHTNYRYLLDGEVSRPDPASRYQPDGVHGASEIIHPGAFPWTDAGWTGISKRDLIIYELHIGAFTHEGTFRAAIERLAELVDVGVTAVEIMPVAQTPGRWNWGYDGVGLFAVCNTYGSPDDLKALVDACHDRGLAVILDVVYNHVGPEGNYLADFGPYFSDRHRTPWGEAFNFDGPLARPVRQFIIENAIRWLDEYHLDGLRLDAVHCMHDERNPNILTEIRAAVADFSATTERVIHLIAEANVYDPDLHAPEGGVASYDAAWCDCLMHSIYTHALPGLQLSHRVYRGAPDLAEVLQHGYLYCSGDHQPERVGADRRRELSQGSGQPPIGSFVTALQTHDGVGNHPHGKRLHHLAGKNFQKAAAALSLLYPSIPLIFMGEESACNAPFPFFADFEDPTLRQAVDEGRAKEYPQHVWDGAVLPSDSRAFLSAKCHCEQDLDHDMRDWYRNLITLRKRGLAEGWLCPARMTSEHDLSLDLFTLRFAGNDGYDLTVYARLSNAHREESVPVTIAGDVLLSSEPITEGQDGRILMRPNHAVIASVGKQ